MKKLMMTSVSKIHLTADIWSKKGLATSYLVVTAQFLIENDTNINDKIEKCWEMTSCVLELSEFPTPHTGLRIAIEILRIIKDWGIPDRVGFILTDNGANMIRSFKDAKAIMEKQVKDDSDRKLRDRQQSQKEQEESLLASNACLTSYSDSEASLISDLQLPGSPNKDDLENEINYMLEERELEISSEAREEQFDENILQNIVDLDPLSSVSEIENEMDSFMDDDTEATYEAKMNGLYRLSCYAHRL